MRLIALQLLTLVWMMVFEKAARGDFLPQCASVDNCRGPVPLFECSLELCDLSYIVMSGSANQQFQTVYGTIPPVIGSLASQGDFGGLWLNNMALTGTLPPSLGSLHALSLLWLSALPGLTGTIPSSLGSCNGGGSLSAFVLSGLSGLTGTIPPSIGGLRLARGEFVLADMKGLTGSIPSFLGSFTGLSAMSLLNLPGVGGTLPPSLGNMTQLEALTVGNMSALTGTIPPQLGGLTALKFQLELSGLGGLSGSLPAGVGSFVNLASALRLADLGLSGTIPSSLGSLSRLSRQFELINIGFTGTIPSSLGSVQVQKVFTLEGLAQVTGTVPPSFGSITRLESNFTIVDVAVTGTLPNSFGEMIWLTGAFVVSRTQLSGQIPPSLAYLTGLQKLDLSNNNFTGRVNIQCVDLVSRTLRLALTHVDLSDNDLQDVVPFSNSQFSSFCLDPAKLSSINLNNNPRLSGDGVFNNMEVFLSLESMTASNCNLTGSVPASLNELTNLVRFEAANNSLSGPLPSALGSMLALSILDVSGNRIAGLVPPSMCSLPVEEMRTCSLQQGNASEPDGDWDCSAISCACAQQLALFCGMDRSCLWSCKPWYEATVVALAVLVVAAVVAFVVLWRRRQVAKRDKIELHRAHTIELLQSFVDQEDDLTEALLPADSIDFNPKSPCIAAGGGGQIFKCTAQLSVSQRMVLKQTVALKEVYAMMSTVQTASGVAEFAKEVAVLMKIRHQHIIQFLGLYFYMDDNRERNFIVTEFAERGALSQYVGSSFKAHTVDRRLLWTRQIGLAVFYLHREGFVHRDIKPANVLLDESWDCKLADFGITRSFLSGPTLTKQIGTVQFMPPEAFRQGSSQSIMAGGGREVKMASLPSAGSNPARGASAAAAAAAVANLPLAQAWDVYSLAMLVVTLFNATEAPFPDCSDFEVMAGVLGGTLRPTRPRVLSSEFHALLDRMWDSEAASRPSMEEFLEELDRLECPSADDGARLRAFSDDDEEQAQATMHVRSV